MGTGGCRYGAGRPGWRRRCEFSLPLDVRRLHQRGHLRPGSQFGWHWTRDGEEIGSIGLSTHAQSVHLSYTRTARGEPETKSYNVPLVYTPCYFGGTRPWFICPWCDRRCAVLYGISGDGYFACRRCMRLGYASESEDRTSRLWRKQRKLEARLAGDYRRPKGMWQRTYQRICDRIEEIEEAKDLGFYVQALKFLRRL
jgi:hypothetical protein